jgi:hypothetical protein
LKRAISDAQAPGNPNSELVEGLQELVFSLDNSIKRGMKDSTGKVNAKPWMKANEDYALTQLVKEAGVTPTGKIDLDGLSNALMSGTEAARTVTNSGGKIKNLQELVKMNYIAKNQAGSDMSGVEMMNNSAGNKLKSGMNIVTGDKLAMNPLRRLFTDQYMKGYPLTEGLGIGTSRQVSRGLAQAGGPLEAMDRFAESGIQAMGGEGSPKDAILKMLGAKPKGDKSLKDFQDLVKQLGIR